MCGIAGMWQPPDRGADALCDTVRRMASAISNRGPDDAGEWADADAGIALGHRRLSIVDLSPLGRCPMHSTSGRYVITYNGEVYNYVELQSILAGEGYQFRGTSDTEVMLAAFERWGIADALTRFVGMFAFAVWDCERRQLTLARDRIGIKPLYVYQRNGTVLFGSELKALRQHPEFRADIDRASVQQYLDYRYVPAPHSIFLGASRVPAGHMLTIDSPGGPLPRTQPYWQAGDVAARAEKNQKHPQTAADAEQQLHSVLQEAVGSHMRADVPLGAFLSGGIDSSLIVSLMQTQSARTVQTFSIGFHDAAYNEASYAAAVARHLGTNHTEMYVTSADALDVVPRLSEIFDEPFADPSQIPTLLVSTLARRAVTVSLSGDGGDELFGGYRRYQWVPRLTETAGRLPVSIRRGARRLIKMVGPEALNVAFARLPASVRRKWDVRIVGDELHKLAAVLDDASSPGMLHQALASTRGPSGLLAQPAPSRGNHIMEIFARSPLSGVAPRMMLCDVLTYLPDDILTKLDRCTMAVGLEGRVPFLDHRVAEFAWALPQNLKIRNGESKWILRQLLYRYLPKPMVDRPKVGFDLPIADWLRGPLREWASDLLSVRRVASGGFLNPAVVTALLEQHLSGRHNHRDILWTLLMFEAWRDHWKVSA